MGYIVSVIVAIITAIIGPIIVSKVRESKVKPSSTIEPPVTDPPPTKVGKKVSVENPDEDYDESEVIAVERRVGKPAPDRRFSWWGSGTVAAI